MMGELSGGDEEGERERERERERDVLRVPVQDHTFDRVHQRVDNGTSLSYKIPYAPSMPLLIFFLLDDDHTFLDKQPTTARFLTDYAFLIHSIYLLGTVYPPRVRQDEPTGF